MSEKWDYDATASLLRFGRKNSGPCDAGIVPDDGDTEMVVSAPQVAADYAALIARHNALREAVAWERETDECGEWLHLAWWDNPNIDLLDIWDIHQAARAEVDRLLEEK